MLDSIKDELFVRVWFGLFQIVRGNKSRHRVAPALRRSLDWRRQRERDSASARSTLSLPRPRCQAQAARGCKSTGMPLELLSTDGLHRTYQNWLAPVQCERQFEGHLNHRGSPSVIWRIVAKN
ncbi:hypothetical protein NLM33_35800 [Bradyrhizobium sp. CCGUVB1N3]|uniref:hypothetical protein n=1 Tax=Bradyrhizobium sp. CCGUVB1N3 TaxID=2949629 RepID=UPI0020B32357|nr:hypothetical protein [Bradyrhizobium sp. CCGUVB1N3]MCP3475640.1 hypothetical protein [Bradyrhizobium sp. CCGUVB1N3]